jgi:pimeloyl-ACP methyl ester carboxylesterase
MIAPDPKTVVVEHDGLRIQGLDWGGDGEPLLLLHPNGFCAGFFDPLAHRLRDTFRPIGVDLRAHGGTDTPANPAEDYAFALMAADVVAVLDHLEVDSFSALGESLGGGVATMVDAALPGAMRRLMLCEAIAFDPIAFGLQRPLASTKAGGNFMADAARKRRAVWPDRATVRESYGARPPLDVLAPDALDAYVRWGFVDRPDGQIELACAPEDEATIFEVTSGESGAPAAFDHLTSLTAKAVVLHGTTSNLPPDWFRRQAAQAEAPVVEVDGSHFFLQESTERAEALAREHLS